jgi:ketosteroid isomerase-like protein
MARFLHVWQQNGDGRWVVARIVSYDHRAYDPKVIPKIE